MKWHKFSDVYPPLDELVLVQFNEYDYYVGRLNLEVGEKNIVTVLSESDDYLFNMPVEELNYWTRIEQPPRKLRKRK